MNAKCHSVWVSIVPHQGQWGNNAVSAPVSLHCFKLGMLFSGVPTQTFHYLFNTSNSEQKTEQKRLERNAFTSDNLLESTTIFKNQRIYKR
jgi:hypothetical protein